MKYHRIATGGRGPGGSTV